MLLERNKRRRVRPAQEEADAAAQQQVGIKSC